MKNKILITTKMKPLYKCSFCEVSLGYEKELKAHESVCDKNGKTEQERFEARKRTEK